MNDQTQVEPHAIYGSGGIAWQMTNANAMVDHLGMLPLWFNIADDRPAQEQADSGYKNTAGCGYHPQTGFTLQRLADGRYAIQYGSGEPDEDGDEADPPLEELIRAELRDEIIVLFDCEYVGIIQKDDSFVVARCD
jgi:hypothetical protein